MSGGRVRVPEEWLLLREPADAAARSEGLVRALRGGHPADAGWVVHDLGAGDGSMGRWLAPHLTGAQHWVLHDLDDDLLEVAAARPPVVPEGAPVPTVETRVDDATRLAAADLGEASVVTASALLDLLTDDELQRLVGPCTALGCPVLLTLSVSGHVVLDPPEVLDAELASAFDEHQRRDPGRGALLGPDASTRAATLLTAAGYDVTTHPSPWRLGPADPELTTSWLHGWVGAAVEQRPGLGAEAAWYTARREAQLAAGRLTVTVGHVDVLGLPPETGR